MKGDKAEKKAAKAEKKAAKQEAAAKKKAEKKAANAKKKAAKMEKKAKNRIAKQEEKAEKLAQEADQEPVKGGGKKKKIMIILLIPIVLALLAALAYFVIIPKFFSKDKEPEPEPEPEPISAPVTYQMGQTAVPALPVWDANVLVYLEDPPEPPAPEEDEEADKEEDGKPEDEKSEKGGEPEEKDGEEGEADKEGEDGEEAEGEEEEKAEEPAEEPPAITAVRYRYEGYGDYRELLMGYAAFMTTSDVGFAFVDDTLVRLKEEEYPIMTTHRGVVTLARNAVDEADAGKAMTIQLEWTDTNCFVTVDTPEGRVKDPPPPPTANAAASMTLMEAMDFVNSLDPADLGLSGTSMEDYTIYAMDGAVMIDNIPCMHLNVYDNNATGTNVVAGQYFMSSDGQHIYLLHPDTNTVEELDVLP